MPRDGDDVNTDPVDLTALVADDGADLTTQPRVFITQAMLATIMDMLAGRVECLQFTREDGHMTGPDYPGGVDVRVMTLVYRPTAESMRAAQYPTIERN